MKPFVLNRHGRLVFPSNFFPELEFSAFETLEQFEEVIRRDFEAKAPAGADLLERVEAGAYRGRHELLRDLVLHLLWADRFSITMYEKRPTRWRDVPSEREDVFLPVLTPWQEGARKIAAVGAAYETLAPSWDADAEDRIFEILFDLFRHKRHHATDLAAMQPPVAEARSDPSSLIEVLGAYDPDYPVFGYEQILDCHEPVPELEALLRQAMVLHNESPWNRSQARLAPVGSIDDDEFVVLLRARNREVRDFIRRVKAGRSVRLRPAPPAEASKPVEPLAPVIVRDQFAIMPRLEALAVVKGEHECTNEDVIRNSASNWSPMTADEILSKTGIEVRRYTERTLEEIALDAAQAALKKAERGPEEIGAVVFCSCTSTRLMPSVATWLSGQLGIFQTHASVDLIAACAGFPYGLSEGIRLLQEVNRPVLLVFGEKFSDKIGSVRTSRMIFGDGASAIVLGPAPAGEAGDVEVLQSYAGGPASQVNSIIFPNPEFDNDLTVYGPEVKALVRRYLEQMMEELNALPHPEDESGSLLDSIELGIPHQANKTMVTDLAAAAGLAPDRIYFNIDKVGNVSAASIPIAIHDSVRDGVIDQPTRVFAPGFGAGAVGGYAVLRIDPEIVALEQTEKLARRKRISIRRPTRRLRRLTNSLIGRVGQAA
jgi:3-oxoacyl-[acyl-carrier-protein] synthase III